MDIDVCGLGLRLPGVTGPADLVRQLTGAAPVPGGVRTLAAPGTDLAPVSRWTPVPVQVRLPDRLPTRGLRNWPHESLLALAAAAEATAAARWPGEASGAVLWASSTAGLAEYAAICTDAALLDPGLTSPVRAPLSAFNGPASTVSIRLGLTGPTETVIGGVTAGMSAVLEAVRFLRAGAGRAVAGGSASISRWSVPDGGGAPAGAPPAEGAACLALERRDRAAGRGRATGAPLLRAVRRFGFTGPDDLATRLAAVAGPQAAAPAVTVVSAADPAIVDALPGPAGRAYHLERRLGDFGAAGGLLAVAAAVAACGGADGPATARAVAIEPGTAAVVEVARAHEE
ncbi:beta-ketoacyl synthase N-terminal-like domain-containing protein [Plantactinospora sp. KBS50]|uniref:beta-ketoacyl synthase N-terminal-like domain-containing protein n=1 Tax=Plantactinospora sp. KBS50 TaxID=2024580 RepID=UPI000BAABFB3|nr:beta-ketoacyl synthase N-terminal-like domain-containing protein [Plantactinospora sp. KBS50]ASW56231.1 hypothetical protein CIK06_21830 [Plantactinospora sp. KBS50]